ncbi:hypothetical protein CAPN006_08860 [Capnocytophaga canimorsus]|uniref:phage baseplate protein n=1 Tax=Capnocytophaga canimorsus TaxID=28188 RepID=UPI001AC11A56|nr:hypothetical protein [Capnocytophaga canimorsus]GIM56492.1 hypothetical protein CAPN006_08860 [Capnocytophaga canimorsus]
MGQLPGDTDFGTLGKTLGEKTHKLTINEIPKHSHKILLSTNASHGEGLANGAFNIDMHDGSHYVWNTGRIENVGGSQSHNNIQPSRIVRFYIPL